MNTSANLKYGYTGLSEAQVKESFDKHGDNSLTDKKPKSLFSKILENLGDPIVKILICALIANIVFNINNVNWAECGGIVLAIVISTLVSTISERGSEKAFDKIISDVKGKTCRCIRDGTERIIPISSIVTGDIIILGWGEAVPCDCRIIHGEITVDQSAVNGESAEVKKHPSDKELEYSPDSICWLFRGSLVSSGSCIVKAEKVGDNTLYGKIAGELTAEKRTSPMKLRLESLASTVSKIGYFAAGLVALTYLFNVFILDSSFDTVMIASKLSDWRFIAQSLIKAVTIGITVIVVAVPEGLPMMITVVLSSNMKRMLKDNVLIRKPVGIETAGSINLLFTDKTGTITTGKLTVDKVILHNEKSFSNINEMKKSGIISLFLPSVICNSEASFVDGKAVGGNSTERALINFTGNTSVNKPIIEKIPFDSKNKYSAAVTHDITYYKGAPEKLIPLCDYCYDENGRILPFDNKEHITSTVYRLSENGNRVIAMTCAVGDKMIFLAIVNIKDKIRQDAKRAVSTLKRAGIQIVMITGDSKPTAEAIAKESGIIDSEKNVVIDGQTLSKMTDDEIKRELGRIRVVCRALPRDKSRLVTIAEEMGMVVGMTGDGVNDAPALKKADVGFALGGGSDIAKEAGDIVILDDNLSSIEKAILYGKTIFKNIRKFILFQLTMNLCAVGVTLFGQLMGIDNPVTVIQMLWVNIIMDTLGGLAFAGEAPLLSYMKEKPKRRNEPIVTSRMLWRVGIMGGYAVTICTMFLASSKMRRLFSYNEDPVIFLSAFFALFIFTGIAICFTSRSERFFFLHGIGKNKPFIIIMSAVCIVQLAMIYIGGDVFRCAPLTPDQLLTVMLISLSVIPFDLLRKIIIKIFNKS